MQLFVTLLRLIVKINKNKAINRKNVIQLKDINKTYNNGAPLHVLKGIDLDIRKGEFVSIMGASGSGKSTLLNILGILDNYDTGEYYLNGTLIKNLSENKAAEHRNRMIGFIFQSFNLISFKDAVENVALPLFYQGVSRRKRNAMALEYLERLGLKEWAHHMPNEMSGGQKQRVAIARALITRPQIILADEPTGALDSKTSVEVMQILKDLHETGMTIVVVTHESGVANQTDKIIHRRQRRSVLPFIDCLRRVKAKRRLYIVYGKACGLSELCDIVAGLYRIDRGKVHFSSSPDKFRYPQAQKAACLFSPGRRLITISEGSVARQSRYTGYTVSPIRGSFSRFSCHGRASRQLFSCSKTACCSLMEKMAEEIAFMIAFPFVNFNFCMHYTIRFSICHSTCG